MIFCHFRPLTQKLKFGKNVKNAWRYYPFTHYMCTINQDHMMYGSWDIKCKGQRLCHYGPFFPPWPSQQPKKSKLKKKKPGDIIILHLCTTNDDHMMYDSYDIKHDRQNFLSFWATFCPSTPLTIQKIKILKKWKKFQEYFHFTHEYHKSKPYDVWFLRYVAWPTEFFLILTIFCPFTPYPLNNPTNQNFEKNGKKPLEMSSFYTMYHKWQPYDIWFPRYQLHQTDFFILGHFFP